MDIRRVTSLTGSGLKDWFMQRVSAIVLSAYFFFILGYFIAHPHPSYVEWAGLYSYQWVKIFTLISFLFLIMHAWVGIWTVMTDYVKCSFVRVCLQLLFVMGYLAGIIWCAVILWG